MALAASSKSKASATVSGAITLGGPGARRSRSPCVILQLLVELGHALPQRHLLHLGVAVVRGRRDHGAPPASQLDRGVTAPHSEAPEAQAAAFSGRPPATMRARTFERRVRLRVFRASFFANSHRNSLDTPRTRRSRSAPRAPLRQRPRNCPAQTHLQPSKHVARPVIANSVSDMAKYDNNTLDRLFPSRLLALRVLR